MTILSIKFHPKVNEISTSPGDGAPTFGCKPSLRGLFLIHLFITHLFGGQGGDRHGAGGSGGGCSQRKMADVGFVQVFKGV